MTQEHREYILANWKNKTPTQIAKEIDTPAHIVRAADVHNFLAKNNITPITNRDIITKGLLELYEKNQETTVKDMAIKLHTSQQTIKEIIEELELEAIKKPGKNTDLTEEQKKELEAKRVAFFASKKERSKKIKEARAKFTIYNQTGSDILDELRGIKTIKRECTLVSNTR